MTIAILYICTGKYFKFWNEFYSTAQTNLLKFHKKHYFVFTDNKELLKAQNINVTYISQKKIGWPFDTLYRFKIFLGVKESLKNFDYVYYINANALIVSEVNEEIFPSPYNFIGCQHPCFYDKYTNDYIYERNPNSTAFIELGNGMNYLMGAFIGGESKAFVEMCEVLNENIDTDYNKGVIAIWHDESHYNKYLLARSYKILSPSYVYPEEMTIPFVPKIILRDKNKYGGHSYLRELKRQKLVFRYLKWLLRKLKN